MLKYFGVHIPRVLRRQVAPLPPGVPRIILGDDEAEGEHAAVEPDSGPLLQRAYEAASQEVPRMIIIYLTFI